MSQETEHRTGGLSNRAALFAVVMALIVGVVGSLALRPPSRDRNASSSSNPHAENTLHWKLPVAFGTHLPALGDNALYISERVSAVSNGTMQLEVYEPGAVVPAFSIVEAVKEGKIEAGYTWLGYDQGRIPASVLFGAVPFGMEPWEYTAWWYYDEGQALAEELYRTLQVHPVLCGLIGPETAGWFRNEIESLQDLQGLKIRFAGLGGMVMQELGASVTMLPGGEIFQALEKGAIDATEFSMPAIDQRLGFDRIVKFNYFPGWHQPFSAFHLVVNLDDWNGLNDHQRAVLDTTCSAAVMNSLAKGEALQGAVLKDFAEKGVQVRVLPDEVLRELESVTQRVLEVQRSQDASFAKIHDSQRAFSARYKDWKRLGFLPRDF
jgi:TRAP-type mannitol/chloroaromatic compound transport system substrate-binding protein